MEWHDVDEFLDKVCKNIRYKGCHNKVKQELRGHIEDHVEELTKEGIEEAIAINKALETMGSTEEIGALLNRVHNPFLGFLVGLTSFVKGILVFICIFMIVVDIGSEIFPEKSDLKKEDLVYEAKLSDSGKIDCRMIKLKNVEVNKSGDVYISFDEYINPLYISNMTNPFKVYDDKGKEYFVQNGGKSGGLISQNKISIYKFDRTASKLVLDYDYYNRKLSFDIPMKAGEEN